MDALESEARRKKGVQPAGVNEDSGTQRLRRSAFALDLDVVRSLRTIDLGDGRVLTDVGSHLSRPIQEKAVEIGTEHLVRLFFSGKQSLSKIEPPDLVSALTYELGAELCWVTASLDPVMNSELVEQGQVLGQKRFADVEPGEPRLLQNNGLVSFLSKVRRHRRTGRATSDHGNVESVHGHTRLLRYHGVVPSGR